MSAARHLQIGVALPVILLACLLSDSAWFFLGRRFGTQIVGFLCRMSLEAMSCVSRTQSSLRRRGAVTLLFAKFVPGLSTMAAPMAGQSGLPYRVFALYDMTGTLIWAGSWLFAGRFFGDLAERSHHFFSLVAHSAAVLVLLMVAGVLVARYIRRVRFRRQLRVQLEMHT